MAGDPGRFIDWAGTPTIDWGKLGSYLAKGGVFAVVWGVLHVLTTTIESIGRGFTYVAGTISSRLGDIFSPEPIREVFAVARASLPDSPLAFIAGIGIALLTVWAIAKAREVVLNG